MIAFVLAAGAGERMGGPKALLLVNDKTLAESHVARALEVGCDLVVIATRPEIAERLADRIANPRVRIVVSRESEPAGTLGVAVRSTGPRVPREEIALVTPVDALPASAATIDLLRRALDHGALASTPRHAGRGGHPVVCKMHVLGAYANEGPAAPLRDTLLALGDARVRVDVDDPDVAIDFDTPEEFSTRFGVRIRFA